MLNADATIDDQFSAAVIGAVGAASLAAYEEAVFRVDAAGVITPMNPAAQSLEDRVGANSLARISSFGAKAIKTEKAYVDMADVGLGDAAMNLQVTVIPLADRRAALCFIRDLTLDPEHDYQPLGRKPGPAKGTPQRGGRRKKNRPLP